MSSQGGAPEGSGCAGAVLLTAAGIGVGFALFHVAPDAAVLVLWAVGWTSIVWSAARRKKIDNPSPPPPGGVQKTEEPQVSIEPDPDNPHRWRVNHKQTGTS